MSKKTTAAAAVAFVAVAGFVGFGLWKRVAARARGLPGPDRGARGRHRPQVTARIAQILVKEGDQIAVAPH